MGANQVDLVLTPLRERAVIRVGTVLETGPPVLVDVDGQTVRAGRLGTYTPVAGHRVALALQDASWLVLGNIVGA